ncbi:hypothetical protein HHI36_003395 [Cryptolaemus montrouzieri]|uniref:Uncharacterized protein n=1 Tax=Cryptolaemus montrouzieri TaxID=559131 RepID=A0ABD2PE96_9CUCU
MWKDRQKRSCKKCEGNSERKVSDERVGEKFWREVRDTKEIDRELRKESPGSLTNNWSKCGDRARERCKKESAEGKFNKRALENYPDGKSDRKVLEESSRGSSRLLLREKCR